MVQPCCPGRRSMEINKSTTACGLLRIEEKSRQGLRYQRRAVKR